MAFKNVKKLPDFTGIGANQLATSVVPASGKYFDLLLRPLDSATAVSVTNMIADITNLRALINGETIIDAPAEVLLMLQNYYYGKNSSTGDVNTAGQLPLFFSKDFYRDAAQGDTLGLGMQDVDSFTLEADCGALVGTAAHVDKIEVRGNRIEIPSPISQHVRIQKFPQDFGSTGEEEITDLPREPNVGVLAYHIFYDDNTTDLTDVTVIRNSSELIKVTAEDNNTLLEKAGRTPQFNASGNSIFTIDFALSNDLNGFFDMRGVQDLRLRLNWATAAPSNYTVYREAVFGLNPNRN